MSTWSRDELSTNHSSPGPGRRWGGAAASWALFWAGAEAAGQGTSVPGSRLAAELQQPSGGGHQDQEVEQQAGASTQSRYYLLFIYIFEEYVVYK